jgi:ribose 5-phosphate isomerase B
MVSPRIAVASDHAGLFLKREIIEEINNLGLQSLDLGTHTPDSVDYPDFADRLAASLHDGDAQKGVLLCGTGIGISIAANRHRHIRAALCHDVTTARLCREHNDANVLVLGGRTIGSTTARECLRTFLDTPFAGGRHQGRVDKLSSAAGEGTRR